MEYNDRSWISNLIIERPGYDLTDILAGGVWKEVILGCIPCPGLDEGFGIQGMNAFCFYGQQGTGKHTTALAFAGSIPEEEYRAGGFRTFLVSGSDLEGSGTVSPERRLRMVFEEAVKGPSAVILEDLRSDPLREAAVRECLRCRSAENLTVFLIEEDLSRVRESWQRAMLLCRFELPSYEERLAFFHDSENRMPRRGGRPTESALAEKTEGMNYIQMKNLVRMIRLRVKAAAVYEYGRDADKVIRAYQDGNVYYTESQFEKYRDLLEWRQDGGGDSSDNGRIRVFLENAPVIAGGGGIAPDRQYSEPEKSKEPLLTNEMIEQDLFAELDQRAGGTGV